MIARKKLSSKRGRGSSAEKNSVKKCNKQHSSSVLEEEASFRTNPECDDGLSSGTQRDRQIANTQVNEGFEVIDESEKDV